MNSYTNDTVKKIFSENFEALMSILNKNQFMDV